MTVSEKVKAIKRSFRLYMNGEASRSMRDKGLDYKINWGISQLELRNMAGQYGKDAALADALWVENIRECKILATLVMPATDMSYEQAGEWLAGITSVELAEVAAFNLFQHLPFADALVADMLQSDNAMLHVCAYNLACRLVRRGVLAAVGDRFFAVAAEDIHSDNRQVLHPLVICLQLLVDAGAGKAAKSAQVLKEGGFDAF